MMYFLGHPECHGLIGKWLPKGKESAMESLLSHQLSQFLAENVSRHWTFSLEFLFRLSIFVNYCTQYPEVKKFLCGKNPLRIKSSIAFLDLSTARTSFEEHQLNKNWCSFQYKAF